MRTFRNIVFWLHLAGGCAAGVVILTMAVTGALLSFEHQITRWVEAPAVLESHPGAVADARLEPILTALKSSGRGVPSELVLHNSTKAPVEARFGRQSVLFLNPWTAEIVGQPSESARGFFASVERIHRSLGLGMQNAMGRGIVGAANLVFLLMVVSGMYLWLPKVFSLAALKMRLLFRAGTRDRMREWNWHHVVGFWTSVPLFFIVLTGVIMSYPWASNLLFTLTGSPLPASGFQGERGPRGNVGNRGSQSGPGASDSQANGFRGCDCLPRRDSAGVDRHFDGAAQGTGAI